MPIAQWSRSRVTILIWTHWSIVAVDWLWTGSADVLLGESRGVLWVSGLVLCAAAVSSSAVRRWVLGVGSSSRC
jgi:hypothetical protein